MTKSHPDLWQHLSVLIATRDAIYFLQGPTEAERKIEELTRQLEEEMEKQEEEGEYFGKERSIIVNIERLVRSHQIFMKLCQSIKTFRATTSGCTCTTTVADSIFT